MTTPERERTLRAIRFPIFRGLFGWRLLLVRDVDTQRLINVRTLADLQGLRLVQGHDWPDADILAANGLTVMRATHFDALFAMLGEGRADALPRSLLEVPSELARYGARHRLALEPNLVLRYPTAVYYFVAPHEEALAHRIEQGLRQLLARGDSARLLHRFHAEAFAQARLPQRRVIELHNPLLPPGTPLAEAALWE